VRIETAGTVRMIMVAVSRVSFMCIVIIGFVRMLVMSMMGLAMLITEMTHCQPRQRLCGDARSFATFQHRFQERFHIRANPVKQIGIANLPYVGWPQRVMVSGGSRREQHLRFAHAFLNGRSDQLQRLDAGD